MKRAWYSLVRYVPELDRGEGANVGLLLYSPDHDFARIQMSETNKWVVRLFGRESYDDQRLKLAKVALRRRIERDLQAVDSVDALQDVLRREGNRLQFSALHEVRVNSPGAEFADLFEDLVEPRERKTSPRPRRIPEWDEVMERLELIAPVQRNVVVPIPHLEDAFRADLAYQNGARHLVKGQWFHKHARKRASELGSEGLLLSKHSAKDCRVTVVSKFDAPDDGIAVREILRAHGVRCVSIDEMDAFEAEVVREAHEVEID